MTQDQKDYIYHTRKANNAIDASTEDYHNGCRAHIMLTDQEFEEAHRVLRPEGR